MVLGSTHARVAGLAAGGAHKTLFGFEIVENMCERAHAEPPASAGNAPGMRIAPGLRPVNASTVHVISLVRDSERRGSFETAQMVLAPYKTKLILGAAEDHIESICSPPRTARPPARPARTCACTQLHTRARAGPPRTAWPAGEAFEIDAVFLDADEIARDPVRCSQLH
jgi:hypothetical protein